MTLKTLLRDGLDERFVRNWTASNNEDTESLLSGAPSDRTLWCYTTVDVISWVLFMLLVVACILLVIFWPTHLFGKTNLETHQETRVFLSNLSIGTAVMLVLFIILLLVTAPLEKRCKEYTEKAERFTRDLWALAVNLGQPLWTKLDFDITQKAAHYELFNAAYATLLAEQQIRAANNHMDTICELAPKRTSAQEKLKVIHRITDKFGLVEDLDTYYADARRFLEKK